MVRIEIWEMGWLVFPLSENKVWSSGTTVWNQRFPRMLSLLFDNQVQLFSSFVEREQKQFV